MTGVTLCSGGGIVEESLKSCVRFVGAVEFDPKIAVWHEVAHPETPVLCADVCDVDYRQWAGVDYLHASPSCKKASVANANRGEAPEDISAANAVCRAIQEIRPRVFTLENVRGYGDFDCFKAILTQLDNAGYYYDYAVYNAADFGTPQTRQRLYVRAWRENAPLPRVVQTHMEREKLRNANYSLFDEPCKPWVGWYEAIEDLLPTLPETQFADWQLKRLGTVQGAFATDCGNPSREFTKREPAEPFPSVVASMHRRPIGAPKAFLVNGIPDNHAGDMTPLRADTPVPPVTASADKHPMRAFLCRVQCESSEIAVQAFPPAPNINATHGAAKYRAFLVEGDAAGERPLMIRASADPCFNLKTAIGGRAHRAWLDSGRVVKITPRCLARFQGLPDSYPLPDSNPLATTIIGNGVAVQLQRAITLPLLCREVATI